jgi:non-heme chloroperoxidase
LYEQFAVPTPGKPFFRPRRPTSINPDRGPLLIISGEQDHTVPWAIANASFQQQANPARPRSSRSRAAATPLTIDSGWREVADTARAFVQRFTS